MENNEFIGMLGLLLLLAILLLVPLPLTAWNIARLFPLRRPHPRLARFADWYTVVIGGASFLWVCGFADDLFEPPGFRTVLYFSLCGAAVVALLILLRRNPQKSLHPVLRVVCVVFVVAGMILAVLTGVKITEPALETFFFSGDQASSPFYADLWLLNMLLLAANVLKKAFATRTMDS